MISTALFDQPAFRNVIVNGLVLAEDGKKMSKRLKNYPDPLEVVNKYGADALRLCMLSSPVVRAEDLRFSETAVREVMRTVLLPLWNSYSFLVTYARIDAWSPAAGETKPPAQPGNVLDRWILSRLTATVKDLRSSLDSYDLQRGATRFTGFIEDLTNWYIRRSRRRFWKSSNDQDKDEAYQTLYAVLVTFCKLAAPFIPFVTETIYRNLRHESMPESVHLCDYPEADLSLLDEELNTQMARTMSAVSLGRFLRSQTALKIRQPLAAAVLVSGNAYVRADLEAMQSVIAEELNVKSVRVTDDEESLVVLSAKPNLKRLGPTYGKSLREIGTAVSALSSLEIAGVLQGRAVTVNLADGRTVALGSDDLLIQRSEREGLTVANDGDITVALETNLTEALILEGWAREVVSKLQNLRKELKFEVTDRIAIEYACPPEIASAIEAQSAYICSETLAVSMVPGDSADMHVVEMNGVNAQFKLCRTACAK